MTSAIDPTKPTAVMAYTADVRQNFLAAKNEISAFQDGTGVITKEQTAIPTEQTIFQPAQQHKVGHALKTGVTDTITSEASTPSDGAIYLPSFYSQRNVTHGANQTTTRDAGLKATAHYGLMHDVTCSDNSGDLAAVMHAVHATGTDPDGRVDSAVVSYWYELDSVGTGYSSLIEGSQVITNTGPPNHAGATTMVGLGCHINVHDTAMENMKQAAPGTYFGLLFQNDSTMYLGRTVGGTPENPADTEHNTRAKVYSATALALLRGTWQSIFVSDGMHVTDCGLDFYSLGNIKWKTIPDLAGGTIYDTPAIKLSRETFLDFRGETGGQYYIRANSVDDCIDLVAAGTMIFKAFANDFVIIAPLRISNANTISCDTLPTLGAPTFTNSWVNTGGVYCPAGYWKDMYGTVHLQGSIKSGTLESSAFTLPAGYRPSSVRTFPAVSNGAFGSVIIDTSGYVIPTGGSNASYALDGISFRP